MEDKDVAAYDKIYAAAEAGERCPMNDCIPGGSSAVSRLARSGYFIVQIYRLNWRVVEVVATGKRTKPCPISGPAYRTIEQEIPGVPGKMVPTKEERIEAALAATKSKYT